MSNTEGGHWYDRAGKPCYEVPKKDGGTRPVNLRWDRGLQLVPSVTTVMRVKSAPALNRWRENQMMLAALTLTRNPGEPDSAFLERVREDAGKQAAQAAEEGNRIHDAIESAFKQRAIDPSYLSHVHSVEACLHQLFPTVTDWRAEDSFAHRDGFGGKIDLHSPSARIVVDFKGKDFSPEDISQAKASNNKRMAYDQYVQLAAYRRLLGWEPDDGPSLNLFISRSHPWLVVPHTWRAEDMVRGWKTFAATLALWKIDANYESGW